MANPNKLFTGISASKILAKLHLAACQTRPDVQFFNSGVINISKNDTPENPGNADFDLSNKDGKYELAVMIKDFQYTLKYTDEQIKDELAKKGINTSDMEEYKKAKKKYDDANKKAVANTDKKQQQLARKLLMDYMQVFAGKANADKVRNADLVRFIFPADQILPSMFKTYPEFKVPSISKEEQDELKDEQKEEQEKNPNNKKIKMQHVGYKIGFQVKVWTM